MSASTGHTEASQANPCSGFGSYGLGSYSRPDVWSTTIGYRRRNPSRRYGWVMAKGDSDIVRHAYLLLRRSGLDAYEARWLLMDLLAAGHVSTPGGLR